MNNLGALSPADVLIPGSYGDSVNAVMIKLCKAFEAKGLRPAVASISRFMHRDLEKHNVTSIPLFHQLNRRFQPSELRALADTLQTKYSMSLNEFCFAEAQYLFCQPESLRTRAIATILAIEQSFDSVRPAFCVVGQGNEISTNAFYAITKLRQIPMVSFGAALPHIKGKGFLHLTDKQDFKLSKIYRYNELDSSAVEQAKLLREQIIHRNRVITYYNEDQGQSALASTVSLAGSYIAQGELSKLAAKAKTYTTNHLIGPWRIFRARRLFAPEIPRKFVFLPLHQPNDSNITVCNPLFFRQEWVVEYIARCLPPDVALVIKPHPGVPLPPHEKVRQMTGADNVFLVDPELKASELIERSAAVVIINSSVGLEAFARAKPLLVLGDFPLRVLRGVHTAPDLRELRTVLEQTIAQSAIPEELVLEGLYTLWANMSDGYLWDDSPDYDRLVESAMQAAHIGASLEAAAR